MVVVAFSYWPRFTAVAPRCPGYSHALPIAGLLLDGERASVMVDRLIILTKAVVGAAEVAQAGHARRLPISSMASERVMVDGLSY